MSEWRVTPARIQEYWEWIAVALFLLFTVDLLTSLYAAAVVGVRYESNPVMAWLLVQPLSVLVGVHLVAAVLVSVCFYGVIELLKDTPDRMRVPFMITIELFLGLLVALGLFVFANNLSTIVHGESLLSSL